jgi:hypothetical protein
LWLIARSIRLSKKTARFICGYKVKVKVTAQMPARVLVGTPEPIFGDITERGFINFVHQQVGRSNEDGK